MKVKVLFVCMGNICRSPLAEGVLRKMLAQEGLSDSVLVDSAATHTYHIGDSPDLRAQMAAKKRGYDLSSIVARQVVPEDFNRFDYIFAMDWENLSWLQQQCSRAAAQKLMLTMRYANDHEEAIVPDPYYGTPDGFFKTLDYIEDACEGILDVLKRRVQLYNPHASTHGADLDD